MSEEKGVISLGRKLRIRCWYCGNLLKVAVDEASRSEVCIVVQSCEICHKDSLESLAATIINGLPGAVSDILTKVTQKAEGKE